MATESDPFVSGKEDLKPYEVTFTPPNDYNKGRKCAKEL